MEGTISIKQIISMFVKHIKLILLLAIVGGIASYYYTMKYIDPVYASSGKLYVQNKVTTTETVSTSDLSAGSRLATACSHIFTTEKVLKPISEELKQEYGLNFSTGTLASMISVSTIDGSELLKISVSCADPVQAYRICTMMIEVAPQAYKELIDAGTMTIVDDPKINYNKIAPDETGNAIKGVAIGGVLAIAIAFFIEFMNKEVKPDDDLYDIYGIPVFAEILDFDLKAKSKYKYGGYYDENSAKTARNGNLAENSDDSNKADSAVVKGEA